jgi:SPP1 gp7 family putative phage head morphogenesis protein
MSILSRLFKIFIYEDAIYDASVATARRHAGPLKIVKLGDPASGWLPEPGEEERVAELLAQSELDPNAFLIYHYGINFEAFGTTDKIMNIGKEWDWIERAKLTGMGISKAFVTGEVTYASAEKGLEVFLSRLLTLRQLFENLWLRPKFFKPIAQINQLYLPTPAEVSHRIKIKKGKSERQLIVPDIEWQKTLRPAVDEDKMAAFMKLKEKGFPVSFSTTMSTAGLDFKEQAKMTKEENEFLKKEGLAPVPAEGEEGGGGVIPGMPGGEIPGATPGTSAPSVAPDGLPGVPASKGEIKEEEKKDYYLTGAGNKAQLEKAIKEADKNAEALEGFGLFAEFETPPIDNPHNYKSREDWQRALHNSKIPQDAKNHIKNLENSISDGWEHSFDGMWNQLESKIGRFGIESISSNDIHGSVVESILEHMKKMDTSLIDNSLNGIFHHGKLHSYEALNFEDYKKKKGFKISAVTIDSMEDDLVLRHMKERLENHLTGITNDDIRMAVTEKVKQALSEAIDKSASSAELKKAIKSIYNNAVWRLQQAVRTEASNNFIVATLLGFKEQGIIKAKWNAHNDDVTCPKCRGLNGLEFDVDYLLSLGNHPLIKMAHHQCRCWLTAVISHIDWDRIERQLAHSRIKFQTPTKIEYPVEIKKTFMIRDNQFKNVPVEYEKPIKTVQNRVREAFYTDEWPKEIEFVADVADSPEFIKVYGKREDLTGRVQYWKDASGKVWVSNFYIKDKEPQASIVKIWAENVWPKISEYWKKAYKEKMKPKRIPDLSQETVNRISNVLKPIPIVQPFRVGMMRGISLNKKFREQGDEMAREALRNAEVNETDIEKIVTWRTINPSWTTTGNSVEVGERDLQQEGFVSELAKRSAKDLFVESLGTYIGDGFLLNFRDIESYEHLKNTIFNGKEFM